MERMSDSERSELWDRWEDAEAAATVLDGLNGDDAG